MNLIACVAKNKGMTFLGKRVSKDSAVFEKILEISKGHNLLMNSFSASAFADKSNITVDENFLQSAESNDFCFIENINADPQKVDCVYLFNWNRDYPADFFFNMDLKSLGFKKVNFQDFKGSSHERITLEVYEKN